MQGNVVIVAYRPKPGMEETLQQLTREHLVVLRAEGLATHMPEVVMMAEGGVVVEVFEWVPGGMARAHESAAVQALWGRYAAACDYVPLNTLAETGAMFAAFERLIV